MQVVKDFYAAIEILSRATPKRNYYCQGRRGNRLFELGLSDVALAFTAASSNPTRRRLLACWLNMAGKASRVLGFMRASSNGRPTCCHQRSLRVSAERDGLQLYAAL